MNTNIPGFTRRGNRYRVLVSLDEADASAIAAEAEATAAAPGAVVRSIVRGWLIERDEYGVSVARDAPAGSTAALVNVGRAFDAVRGGERRQDPPTQTGTRLEHEIRMWGGFGTVDARLDPADPFTMEIRATPGALPVEQSVADFWRLVRDECGAGEDVALWISGVRIERPAGGVEP